MSRFITLHFVCRGISLLLMLPVNFCKMKMVLVGDLLIEEDASKHV